MKINRKIFLLHFFLKLFVSNEYKYFENESNFIAIIFFQFKISKNIGKDEINDEWGHMMNSGFLTINYRR